MMAWPPFPRREARLRNVLARRFGLLAAGRPAASALRLRCAYKRADEFSVDLRCEGIHVDALARQEFFRVFNAINARRLQIDLLESSRSQLRAILVLLQCSRDAAHPCEHVFANLAWHIASGH